jgi:hypothetical protein
VKELFKQRENGLGGVEIEERTGSGEDYGSGAWAFFQILKV